MNIGLDGSDWLGSSMGLVRLGECRRRGGKDLRQVSHVRFIHMVAWMVGFRGVGRVVAGV